jgi:hypothetical protein
VLHAGVIICCRLRLQFCEEKERETRAGDARILLLSASDKDIESDRLAQGHTLKKDSLSLQHGHVHVE